MNHADAADYLAAAKRLIDDPGRPDPAARALASFSLGVAAAALARPEPVHVSTVLQAWLEARRPEVNP